MNPNLPESEAKVKLTICPKCGGILIASIEHMMTDEIKSIVAAMENDGAVIKTISLSEYESRRNIWHYENKDCK